MTQIRRVFPSSVSFRRQSTRVQAQRIKERRKINPNIMRIRELPNILLFPFLAFYYLCFLALLFFTLIVFFLDYFLYLDSFLYLITFFTLIVFFT